MRQILGNYFFMNNNEQAEELLLKVTIVDEEEEILNINDQAGELLATFEMFERNGCEGNNMVKKSSLTAYFHSYL